MYNNHQKNSTDLAQTCINKNDLTAFPNYLKLNELTILADSSVWESAWFAIRRRAVRSRLGPPK